MSLARRFLLQDLYLKLVILLASAASLISLAYFASRNEITLYGDALTRLMTARRVVQAIHAGLGQLGASWLPLQSAPIIPFVGNDFLYKTGVAGVIFPMTCYILGVVFIYKLVLLVTGDKVSGGIAALAYSAPNLLYLQATPMSEAPFLSFFVMSVYALMRWVKEGGLKNLVFTAFAVFLSTLTRYEGWVLLFPIVTTILVYSFWKKGFTYKKAEAHFVYFATLGFFGVFLWFTWNQAIFGDFLQFLKDDYASKENIAYSFAISGVDPEQAGAGNLPLSLAIYTLAVLDNVGYPASALGVLGLVYFALKKLDLGQKLVALSMLFPFAFFVFGTYQSGSVTIWHPYFTGTYFNLRFGLQMLPAVAFFVAYLTAKRRWWVKLPVAGLIVLSSALTWQSGLVTLKEAETNVSPADTAAGKWLAENYDGGRVLMRAFRMRLVNWEFSSEHSFEEAIYEGDQDLWEEALEDPKSHVRWVFMKKDIVPDSVSVWERLRNTPLIVDYYDLVYKDGDIEIYRLKEGSDAD